MPAPDYTVEIERLEKVLATGATHIEIDGKITKISPLDARMQLNDYRARAADAAGTRPHRPMIVGIDFPSS